MQGLFETFYLKTDYFAIALQSFSDEIIQNMAIFDQMRKVVAILLLTVYVFGMTELCQIIKLPRMVAHYEQFIKDNPGFGFKAFLRVHYMYPLQTTDTDYEQDRQLPFKCVDYNCLNATANVIVPQPYYFAIPKIFLPQRDYPLHKDDFHSYLVTLSIFQPPKA